MKRITLCLMIIIYNTCYAQKIIKVVDQYVLIDTDKNIGKVNDIITVQRKDINQHIIDIGKIQIIKFSKGMTAAKIIFEYGNHKIKNGDYLMQYFLNIPDDKSTINSADNQGVVKNTKIFNAGKLKFEDICSSRNVEYCRNVGKNAYNNSKNPKLLRNIKLGKIVGVTWKKRGSVILIEDAIPKYNIAEERYFAPKDAYYYIIDYGGGEYFLREVDEIYAR